MKNYLGQAGNAAGKYSELSWKYLFDKGWWVYVAGFILLFFVLALTKAQLVNPIKP